MAYSKEQREAKKAAATTTTTTTDKTEGTAPVSTTMTNDKFRDYKHKWVDFVTERRCYVEGAYLEAGQTITLSPAAAWRQRGNKCLLITDETIIPLTLTDEQVKDLTDGDPRVGAAPKEFNLVQPGK